MPTQLRRLSTLSPRAQGFLLGFVLVALAGAFATVALSATNNTINGCYERRGGELRIRKDGTSCKDGEIAISWNKRGRRGPQGEPGLLSSFDAIEGLSCTRNGAPGTIALTYNSSGEAVLTCELPSSGDVCGDGVTTGAEACDDGNTVNGDGCSDVCTTEAGAACGDGIVSGNEQCDDGNATNGDGCSDVCTTEAGAACGDGIVSGNETCDDGNATNGDGCSAYCSIESCGNGFIDEGEQCDDGGGSNGDGCSASCSVEGGWACTGQPSACSPT